MFFDFVTLASCDIINKIRDVKFFCPRLVPNAYGSIRYFTHNHIS